MRISEDLSYICLTSDLQRLDDLGRRHFSLTETEVELKANRHLISFSGPNGT